MKRALLALLLLASTMASASSLSGTVTKIEVGGDSAVVVTFDGAQTASLESCSRSGYVTDVHVLRAKCSSNEMIFSVLQTSLVSGLKTTVQVNGAGLITAAVIQGR